MIIRLRSRTDVIRGTEVGTGVGGTLTVRAVPSTGRLPSNGPKKEWGGKDGLDRGRDGGGAD